MTQYIFNAETGTAGTALTAGNTGFTLISKAGTTTATFSSTGKAHGALGYRFVAAGGSDIWRPRKDITAVSFASARAYFTLNSLPSQAQNLVCFVGGGSTVFAFGILGGNTVRAVGAGGSTLASFGTALTAGTLYRLEMHWRKGTGTTDGQAAMSLFVGDSTTPLWTYGPVTNVNVGTVDVDQFWLGDNTAGRIIDITFDDVVFDDAQQVLLGPVVNNPPTVTVTGNQNVAASATVNLTASATDTDGSIASYAWTYDYPSTGAPALTGATTATPSFTAGAAGALYVLRCTVTDSGGATASATTEVRVPSSGNVAPLPTDGTGGWGIVGGTTTKGAALSDASDATYLDSGDLSATETEQWNRLAPMTARSALTLTWRLRDQPATSTSKLRLYEGSTLREEWTQALTTSFADYAKTLSNPGAIGDWGNLRIAVASKV